MSNYSSYTNNFTYGRDLIKKLLIAAVIACVASLLLAKNPTLQLGVIVLTVMIFISVIVTICKYCRCPHCGKIIFLGVLALETCPRCKYNLISGKKAKKSRK
ncbi:MAG: hypothetical protein SO014_00695 [Candidatus Limivicinus sp.]|nr:hypothetical protein [Candidatus Limivicinus sp.]